ncbi:protein DpdF [Sorangium sp. So ce124]|uniref:protein DpdF n=1 Tax=Sorangium sp. So ce124 TaxID=3133280 RepID=UPI003F644B19
MSDATDLLEAGWSDLTRPVDLDVDGLSQTDPYHARLARVLREGIAAPALGAGAADLAVLLRAVIRNAGQRTQRPGLWVPETWMRLLTPDVLARHGLQESHRHAGRVHLRALPWTPRWVEGAGAQSLGGIEAPLHDSRLVRHDPTAEADPVLLRIGYDRYQSEAQREAVRTVLSAQPGETVIVLLPTGSGKSACSLLPSFLTLPDDVDHFGVTPIVVPTVSLALDLQRRIHEKGLLSHACAYRPDTTEAAAMRERVEAGVQGPLLLSPEALVGSVKEPLRTAAAAGHLRYLVVDEAHMIATWGDEFRPAFQQLAGVRRELLAACRKPFVTVLLSATLTAYALRALDELFGGPRGLHVVHAVRLRPEPRYYWTRAEHRHEQITRIQEALAHLPRPAILYTTRRKDAIDWHARLLALGYARIGLVHGSSTEDERRKALERWNDDRIDLMVATSAFGLGVDKADVRAVLHACFPESLDRYYQDVGRGGRDGHANLALMVWTGEDEDVASSLARPTLIGVERGLERWRSMFGSHAKEPRGGGVFAVPTDVSPSARPGDIDMINEANERWNHRTLLLMQRAGAVELQGESMRRSNGRVRTMAHVQVLKPGHLDEVLWATDIEPRRREMLAAYDREWELMNDAVRGDRCLAHVLQQAYEADSPRIVVVRACGSCPRCRRRGEGMSIGRLFPRHTPPESRAVRPRLGRKLQGLLSGERLALVLVRAADSDDLDRLRALAEWLVGEGLHDLVLDTATRAEWRDSFGALGQPPLFFHEQRPTGIRRGFPAAAFVLGNTAEDWKHIELLLKDLSPGSVIVLQEDAHEPDRPDRLSRDIVTGVARWPLTLWEDWFLE